MSTAFVFPGSAKSNEALYNKDFGSVGYNDYESPSNSNSNSNNKASTPIQNPLLFRTRPSSFDRNNSEYDESLSSPLALVSTNVVGGGILRRRKAVTNSVNATDKIPDVETKIRMVPPPLASYSLGTHNVAVAASSTMTNSIAAKSFSTLDFVSDLSSVVGERGMSDGVYGSNKNGRLVERVPQSSAFPFNSQDISRVSTIASPVNLTSSMYSPSQMLVNKIGNGGLEYKEQNTTSNWVFVFGATLNALLHDDVMRLLSEFGTIVDKRYRSNWIAVRYQSELEAEKAICHKRMTFYDGTDTVYFTAQRLHRNDPELEMILMMSSGQSAGSANTKGMWGQTPSTSLLLTYPNETDATMNQQRTDSETTIPTSSTASKRDVNDLREEDILEMPHRLNGKVAASVAKRAHDSFCVRVLKWALSITEDEYD